MRKHRLFGVVIAVLLGLGVFTHRPESLHRTPGTTGAGMQLAAAELPTSSEGAGVRVIVASARSASGPPAVSKLVASQATTILSSPFGPQALVTDYHDGVVQERAEVSAYFAAMAERQAMIQAYLQAEAAHAAAVAAARPPARAAVVAPPGNPWPALRQCESDGNYSDDTGNGYYGAYQFNLGTWRSLGLGGLPSQAAPAQQDQAAQELQARRGWGQWPACARRLGLI